jgi:hypothetical protein
MTLIAFSVGAVFGVFIALAGVALVRFVRYGHHIAETFSPVAPEDTAGLGLPVLAGVELAEKVRSFRPDIKIVWECPCDHKLHNTGGVFYQSVGLINCVNCGGWQRIRKGIQ